LLNVLIENIVGDLPEDLSRAVGQLSSDELDSLAVAVIRFRSVEDLRRRFEERW
jgi:hypothetical protein